MNINISATQGAFGAILREYAAIVVHQLRLRGIARSMRGISAARREVLKQREAIKFSVSKSGRTDPQITSAASAANPAIVDSANERQLQFRSSVLQSRMRLDNPYALIAPYTRQMMSFLLFNPDPVHILMIGLGGGSMPKFCYRHMPDAKVTVVELDARVIAMRDSFFVPADDERFRVVHDDGVHYVKNLDELIDVVLIDAFDENGVAPSLSASSFFDDIEKSLTDDGVVIMNLLGEPRLYAAAVSRVREVFGDRVLQVAVPGNDNILLFAFKAEASTPASPQLMLRARHLQWQYQLPFRSYLQRMRNA